MRAVRRPGCRPGPGPDSERGRRREAAPRRSAHTQPPYRVRAPFLVLSSRSPRDCRTLSVCERDASSALWYNLQLSALTPRCLVASLQRHAGGRGCCCAICCHCRHGRCGWLPGRRGHQEVRVKAVESSLGVIRTCWCLACTDTHTPARVRRYFLIVRWSAGWSSPARRVSHRAHSC